MIDRINLILRAKNITAKQFAEAIGIQPSGMSHILGGRNNPSLDFVHKVLRRYPEIDANWLLLGRGEMYRSDAPAPVEPPQPAPESPSLFADVDEPEADESAPTPVAAEPEARYVPSYIAVPPEAVDDEPPAPPATGRVVERMMLIYSDGTFAAYRPAQR